MKFTVVPTADVVSADAVFSSHPEFETEDEARAYAEEKGGTVMKLCEDGRLTPLDADDVGGCRV